MHIRFLLHDLYTAGGGVLTVTFALAQELAQRHRVELVSAYADAGRVPVHALPTGVDVTGLMPPPDPAPTSETHGPAREPSTLLNHLEPRFDYDRAFDEGLAAYLAGLHGGVLVTMQPALTAAVMALPCDTVKVAQEHRPLRGRPRELRDHYRRNAGALDALLTLTRDEARAYRKLVGPDVLVRAIPNGIPVGAQPLASCETPVVVAAGRLQRSKGFDVLIDAWRVVAERHPDWRLRIFGEGDLEDDLRRQVRSLGLEEQVALRGFTPRLDEEMAASSAFVLSSRSEGYPRVILEAMAVGLPVVSTACPAGPREMIDDGVDGFLVPNKDAAALGEALVRVVELGAEGRRAMGASGRRRVESQDQAAVAARWERLLRKLLRERRERRERREGTRATSRA
jgi:glycosyltransferase involved in cell wall biosynthesis